MNPYEKMTMPALRKIAKEKGLHIAVSTKKAALIDELLAVDAVSAASPQKETPPARRGRKPKVDAAEMPTPVKERIPAEKVKEKVAEHPAGETDASIAAPAAQKERVQKTMRKSVVQPAPEMGVATVISVEKKSSAAKSARKNATKSAGKGVEKSVNELRAVTAAIDVQKTSAEKSPAEKFAENSAAENAQKSTEQPAPEMGVATIISAEKKSPAARTARKNAGKTVEGAAEKGTEQFATEPNEVTVAPAVQKISAEKVAKKSVEQPVLKTNAPTVVSAEKKSPAAKSARKNAAKAVEGAAEEGVEKSVNELRAVTAATDVQKTSAEKAAEKSVEQPATEPNVVPPIPAPAEQKAPAEKSSSEKAAENPVPENAQNPVEQPASETGVPTVISAEKRSSAAKSARKNAAKAVEGAAEKGTGQLVNEPNAVTAATDVQKTSAEKAVKKSVEQPAPKPNAVTVAPAVQKISAEKLSAEKATENPVPERVHSPVEPPAPEVDAPSPALAPQITPARRGRKPGSAIVKKATETDAAAKAEMPESIRPRVERTVERPVAAAAQNPVLAEKTDAIEPQASAAQPVSAQGAEKSTFPHAAPQRFIPRQQTAYQPRNGYQPGGAPQQPAQPAPQEGAWRRAPYQQQETRPTPYQPRMQGQRAYGGYQPGAQQSYSPRPATRQPFGTEQRRFGYNGAQQEGQDVPQEQPRQPMPEFRTRPQREWTPPVSDMPAPEGDFGEGGGMLEMHPDGYGFLRSNLYSAGNNDVYVSIAQIRRFALKSGDYVTGKTRPARDGDRYSALVYIDKVNGLPADQAARRRLFEELTPIYPDKRITLENADNSRDLAIRLIDFIAPIGFGQRAMIVSPPKAGKTVLLKKIANAITANFPDAHLIVLLIDERPEEVTDIKRSVRGEVVYSTFDELPENHTRVSEMVIDRAQRLVECGRDVVILLDSLTRLARAYNAIAPQTGRALSGGLGPGALHKPKRFFGAARNIENGGSLTIIATALIETGSRMDDVIYEEFKGTGNMEIHLDRKLSEKRIFPAIDLAKSSTRHEELLLSEAEMEGVTSVRKVLSSTGAADATEQLMGMLERTKTNGEFFQRLKEWLALWEKEGYTVGSRRTER